jgi:hypothetical protein
MKNKTPAPYEITQEASGRAYLIFELPTGRSAWPWHTLRATRITPDDATLTLEYPEHSVVITGANLGILFDLAASTRLKCVRVGECEDLVVKSILPVGGSAD